MSSQQMLEFLSNTLTQSAEQTFGRFPRCRKKRNHRLPPKVVKKLKSKKDLILSILQTSQHSEVYQQLDKLSRDIKDDITGYQIKKRNRLRSRQLGNDPTRRKFWRFLRNQAKKSGSITALYKSKQVESLLF